MLWKEEMRFAGGENWENKEWHAQFKFNKQKFFYSFMAIENFDDLSVKAGEFKNETAKIFCQNARILERY